MTVEVPAELVRASFGRFIKRLGRYYGCKVVTYRMVKTNTKPTRSDE